MKIEKPFNLNRALYFFFFVSGATALMYEVVWLRSLGLVFGNTTYATATVLAAFMLGLGVGGAVMGHAVDRWSRPLRVYSVLELGIGGYAALTFVGLGWIESTYVHFAREMDPELTLFTLVRFLLAFSLVFIPAFLMGGTLPVLARQLIRTEESIGRETSLLYGMNTAGAFAGTLLAGFWMIPWFGMKRTVALAVCLNVTVGLLALWMSLRAPVSANAFPSAKPSGAPPGPILPTHRPPRWVVSALFVSGVSAMMLEVGWTRVLGAVLGSSTYAFTLMLATFLLGMAVGSMTYKRILTRRSVRVSDWVWLQFLLSASVLVGISGFEEIGFVMIRLFGLFAGDPTGLLFGRFLVCVALMIVPTFVFGALFPVSAALYSKDAGQVGSDLGILYLGNTAGNLVGSLATGFLLIPWIGIHHSLLVAGGLAFAMAAAGAVANRKKGTESLAAIGVSVVLLAGMFSGLDGWDPRILSIGMHLRPQRFLTESRTRILGTLFDRDILYYREGQNSIVSVFQDGDHRGLKVNGKTDASTGADIATQSLSGHIPHVLHPKPRRSLVIGMGSGMTLASVLAHPVERVDVVELEPAVVDAQPYFSSINRRAWTDPRARVITNDGRNHLLTTSEQYDVIVSEPSNPWMAGVANLFSVEFYQLAKKHLTQNGVLAQWLQTYAISPENVKMVVATVRSVFPHVTLWSTLPGDTLIVAGERPIVFDREHVERLFESQPRFKEDLERFGMRSAVGLLSYLDLTEDEVDGFVRDADLNRDDTLRLEFDAPRTLNDQRVGFLNRSLLETYSRAEIPADAIVTEPLEKDKEALTAIGMGYLGKRHAGHVDKARAYFSKALELDENYVPAMFGLGRCLLADGKQTFAFFMFTACERFAPENQEYQKYKALSAWRGGDTNLAIKTFSELARETPGDGKLFYWLGEALEEKDRYPEAEEAYRRSVALSPDHLKGKLAYLRMLRKQKKYKAAESPLVKLRAEYRTHPAVFREARAIYEGLGATESVVLTFRDAIQRNPYQAFYWATLARAYETQGKDSEHRWAMRNGRKVTRYFDQILSANRSGIVDTTLEGPLETGETQVDLRRKKAP